MSSLASLNRELPFPPPEQWSDATVLLGGGGARGLAHLGALRAIGHAGIGIGRLVGVSMGALMASLCAVQLDVQRAERVAREFLTSETCLQLQRQVLATVSHRSGSSAPDDLPAERGWGNWLREVFWAQKLISRAARQPSVLPASVLQTIVNALLPDIEIEDLMTPLHLIAVDMKSGERKVLSSGSLRQAVLASMSIPGVFPPVQQDDNLLADVGVYDAVPCDLVQGMIRQEDCDSRLIVVDVGKTDSSLASCRTGLQSFLRAQELAERQVRQFQLAQADVVIKPVFGKASWFDFSEPDVLIEAGYHAARTQLKQWV